MAYLIQLYNKKDNKLLLEYSIAKNSRIASYIFSTMRLEKRVKEALGLTNNQFITDLGIHSLRENNCVFDGTGEEVKVRDYEADTDFTLPEIRVIAIKKGYVLCVNTGYLVSLGKWSGTYSYNKDSARTFSSLESLNKFLSNNYYTLQSFCKEHSWVLDYKPISDEFEEYENKKYFRLSEKKKAIYEELRQKIDQQIESFKTIAIPPIPKKEEAADDEIVDEVNYRIRHLGAPASIATDFKNGIITVSDEDGKLRRILESDENIKNAIKNAEERELIPYHVVLSTLNFPDCIIPCINILYITRDPEDWEFQRPDADGWINIFCVTDRDSEYGAIRLTLPCTLDGNRENMGLKRIR